MPWVPKVGERVRIRAKEFLRDIGPGMNRYMLNLAGQEVTIKRIVNSPYYVSGYEIYLVEHSYTWILDWFEPLKYPPGTSNLEKYA